MKNVERIVILYPGDTSSERINQPANYSLSRLLIRLHELDPVPVYFLNWSDRHEQYGNIEFSHLDWRNVLKVIRRFAFARNTLILTQTPRYVRPALWLRSLLRASKLIVRLGGVFYGRRHITSPAFTKEVRRTLAPMRRADMVISTADGTPVDAYMQRVGVPRDRYRKWMNGFPVIENAGGYERRNQVTCISRLSMEKGIDYVIESFASALPRLQEPHRLVIVGDGPERANLEALASSLGIASSVDFVGDSFDIARHLYSSKLLISGLANNPIMEAIATGTPVVAVELGETEAMYGGYPNVHVVDYPPGGCGRIDPAYRESLVAETARVIASVVNDESIFESPDVRPQLNGWDERLTMELELYDSLFDASAAPHS